MQTNRIANLLLMGTLLQFMNTSCGGATTAASSNAESDPIVDTGGGSGASGGTGSALTVAGNVSVVDPKSEETPSSSVSALARRIGFVVPVDSDYMLDETNIHVQERTAESFKMINEILCIMDMTAYDEMVNQGDYNSQFDRSLCATERDDATNGTASSDQSTGSGAPDFSIWPVNSFRFDDNSHQIVSLWANEPGDEHSPDVTFKVKADIAEGKTEINPLGIFTMNIAGAPTDDTSNIMMRVHMNTELQDDNTILLNFANEMGTVGSDQFESAYVSMSRGSDGTSGAGSVSSTRSSPQGTESVEANFAYNANYFLKGNDEGDACLDRNNFDETTWRYGLYDATDGSRLEINSGFPVYTEINGSRKHGYIGYYGLWFSENVDISNGDTVYRENFGQNDSAASPYTVLISGGRLVKHIKQTITLADMIGQNIDYGFCDEHGCTQSVIQYDGSGFVKVGERDNQNGNQSSLPNPEPFEIPGGQYSLDAWCQGLGGSIHIATMSELGEPIDFGPETPVVFYREETVYPSTENIPTALWCSSNCPDYNKLADANAVGSNDVFLDQSTWESGNESYTNQGQGIASTELTDAQRKVYSLDADTLTLTDTENFVVMGDGVTSDFGVRSGPMYEPTDENLAALACPWDAASTCSWRAWDSLDEFYTWETGSNAWNKMTAIKDADNNVVSFDAPMQFAYTRNTGEVDVKYFLQYGGQGDLWGIPGKCVDMDSGEDINCSDGAGNNAIRWVPEFSIEAGATVVDAKTSQQYLVKPLEMEQRMQVVDTALCNSAGLTLQDFALPDLTNYEEPDIGDTPVIDGPPAVLNGVVQ